MYHAYSQVPKGWHGIVDRLEADLLALGWDGKVDQVKEKFGGLRFYISNGTSAMYERIEQAEIASQGTCQVCGAAGRTVDNGWLATLCEEHGKHA